MDSFFPENHFWRVLFLLLSTGTGSMAFIMEENPLVFTTHTKGLPRQSPDLKNDTPLEICLPLLVKGISLESRTSMGNDIRFLFLSTLLATAI
jgi:hypothetical protein